jgi:hypothetical protein
VRQGLEKADVDMWSKRLNMFLDKLFNKTSADLVKLHSGTQTRVEACPSSAVVACYALVEASRD